MHLRSSVSPNCLRLAGLVFISLLGGCSAVGPGEVDDADAGSGSTGGDGDLVGDGDGDLVGDGDLNVGDGDGDGDIGSGGSNDGPPVDPCLAAGCGVGQRCELTDQLAQCIDITCEELNCTETEECRAHELGGNTCVNLFCTEDVDCAPEDYCDENGDCVPDICEGGENSCEADGVHVCSSNGSSEEVPYSCGSPTYFGSVCDSASGQAACSCEDDWDCPAYTVCDVDHCVGTGFAPTCTLPPSDFNETDPVAELHWGTDTPGAAAHDGSGDGTSPPWPASVEVQTTPMVANLNDDNGDGRVNELDFPEIIFITYEQNQDDSGGILRAIHGGGPNRGKDFFAVCASDQNRPDVWAEGDPLPTSNCIGDSRSRSPVAVGDLNQDGIPEVVQVTANNGFRVLSNTGQVLINRPNNQVAQLGGGISASPSIANLDYAALPELIIGTSVFVFDVDAEGMLLVSHIFDHPGVGADGTNDIGGPMSCVADLSPDAGQEILAGNSLFGVPAISACATPPCAGLLSEIWTANAVSAQGGLCAVADIWGPASGERPGPDNLPDGVPEAILIADGSLVVLDGATGTLIHEEPLEGGVRGGAPNVDDFDGDGFMEVATALSAFYTVIDLQEPEATNCPAWTTNLPRAFSEDDNPNAGRTPGDVSCTEDTDCNAGAVCNEHASACVCLHNGWKRDSDDSSSSLTSSSVFDFNGDGATEVIYNDECDFRIYDGVSGAVHFSEVSRSRTWTENPVVADVDNDGNAEVVSVMNTDNENKSCDDDPGDPTGPNGVRVWGDPQDTWVPARRIWNQQSYHVTNVTEGGQIPYHAPESWGEFNGLTFNTYRSQPRTFGVAPDLTVTGIGIFSPDALCGVLSDVITITYEITNAGDLRVGPGVQVSFYGIWGGAEEPLLGEGGVPLTANLSDGIEPGRSIIETVAFAVANQTGQTTLPDEVRVQVDTGGENPAFGAERECDEANNDRIEPIEAGEELADLSIVVGEATVDCATKVATAVVTVTNSGASVASNVVVHLFAGNPAQGGTRIGETVLAELGPGASVTVSVQAPDFPKNRAITIWGFVDPGDTIEECNEADNTEPADNDVECREVIVVIK